MYEGPNIARIASLIGEPARAHVLAALLSGTALTATELAEVAGVTRATVSAHLAKLLDARLLAVESQGRHRYFRLAGADVAHALESLMDVAARASATTTSPVKSAYRSMRAWSRAGCCDRRRPRSSSAATRNAFLQHCRSTSQRWRASAARWRAHASIGACAATTWPALSARRFSRAASNRAGRAD